MAIQSTAVPRDAKVSVRGRTISFVVGEDLDLNSYALLVDTPCIITIEPMPSPAGDVMVDDGLFEDDIFEVD